MRERPILFSAPMVRAILEGRKTQTRRVVMQKGGPVHQHRDGGTWRRLHDGLWYWCRDCDSEPLGGGVRCPYGQPGDKLWVRETWRLPDGAPRGWVDYRADDPRDGFRWRPSIHMPRWASRIGLEITGVRVERLQAISDADAFAEGIPRTPYGCHLHRRGGHGCVTGRAAFEGLWDCINSNRPGAAWAANPWVWVVEFRRVEEVRNA